MFPCNEWIKGPKVQKRLAAAAPGDAAAAGAGLVTYKVAVATSDIRWGFG